VGQWLSVGRNRYIAAAGTAVLLVAVAGLVVWGGRRKQQFAMRALDEARASAEAGNLPLAASQLQRVITTYGGTDAAAEATMALNQVRLVNGQSELAVTGLREFIKSNPAPKYLGPSQSMLGIALENTRKPAEAAEAFVAASKAAELPFLKAEYLVDAGRAYTNAGKKDEAIKVYRQVVNDMKDQPAYTEAMVRLAELTGGQL
jgi:TolA-binding protein